MLMANPVRCDNWDRLLLGMSLFAGDSFEPLEMHPFRDNEKDNGNDGEETEHAALERRKRETLLDPELTTEQKKHVIEMMNRNAE